MITQTSRLGWHPQGIGGESISNIEIFGFSLDAGNNQEEPSGDNYNTIIHFTYPYNIKIHHMRFRNGQWDAIRLSSADFVNIGNTEIYNNYVFASGHDAISFVGVIGCNAHHN